MANIEHPNVLIVIDDLAVLARDRRDCPLPASARPAPRGRLSRIFRETAPTMILGIRTSSSRRRKIRTGESSVRAELRYAGQGLEADMPRVPPAGTLAAGVRMTVAPPDSLRLTEVRGRLARTDGQTQKGRSPKRRSLSMSPGSSVTAESVTPHEVPNEGRRKSRRVIRVRTVLAPSGRERQREKAFEILLQNVVCAVRDWNRSARPLKGSMRSFRIPWRGERVRADGHRVRTRNAGCSEPANQIRSPKGAEDLVPARVSFGYASPRRRRSASSQTVNAW